MSEPVLSSQLASRLAHELVSALATAVGTSATAEPLSDAAASPGFLVSLKVSGTSSGVVVAWIDAAVAERAVRGMPASAAGRGAATFEEVIDLVRNMAMHASAMVSLAPEFAGLRMSVSAVTPGPAPAAASLFQCAMWDDLTGTVGVLTALTDGAAEAEPPVSTSERHGTNLDLVLDVELPLVVRFGRTVLSLKTLSGLGPGSVVDMGRSPDAPVELLVSDQVIALGEVVIVDGSYGLRITDLVTRPDRVQALETR